MKIDYTNVLKQFRSVDLDNLEKKAEEARETLLNKTGLGAEMTGWIDYPNEITKEELSKIKRYAKEIRSKAKILVVIGIGGSYLGTKAVIEVLKTYFKDKSDLKIMYAGFTLSSSYMVELLHYLEDKEFCINYVSKSGNTTEPALSFRLLSNLLKQKHPDDYQKYVYVTTDGKSGQALLLSKKYKYKTMVIPESIGGRYSLFTPSTLLPLASAGIDIDSFIDGAKKACVDCKENKADDNIALKYAAFRNLNYQKGKKVEILCVYSPRFSAISSWWEQLFGESEGKNGKGLFPTSLVFSTDLHSVGQFIQEGSRVMFETILFVKQARYDLKIPFDKDNYDNLNYLSDYTLHKINVKMLEATILAHTKGGTPNIVFEIDKLDTYNLGYLMYTLMFACAVSGYILGVNPFNQPGVERYKENMYALLGKPGFEELRKDLEKIL